jgi:NTE family protein
MSEIESLPKKKLGLALGGGGARGLAHIGVLKVLAREGIRIDVMAGTSMGGLISAIYGAGLTPEAMEAEALRRSTTREIVKLVDINPSIKGLVKGTRIYNLLADTLGSELTFADLQIPVAMVAADVLSGKEVIFKEGKVADAVRATISVPGVFVPVDRGDYKLVDGGVLNNVPVNVARDLGAELVIAVDVLPNFQQNQPGQPPIVIPLNPPRLPKPVKEIYNILLIMVSAMTESNLRVFKPDLIIRPELPADLDLLMSFGRPIDAISAGEKAAEEALPRILELIAGVS